MGYYQEKRSTWQLFCDILVILWMTVVGTAFFFLGTIFNAIEWLVGLFTGHDHEEYDETHGPDHLY